jgi:hypothetical protein
MISLDLFGKIFDLFLQSSHLKSFFAQLPTSTSNAVFRRQARATRYVRLDHTVCGLTVGWRIENRWSGCAGEPDWDHYREKNSVEGRGVSNVLKLITDRDVRSVVLAQQIAFRIKRFQTDPRSLLNLHNVSLARIDAILKIADADQRASYEKFDDRPDIASAFAAAAAGGGLCGVACLLVWWGNGQSCLWLLRICIALGAAIACAAPVSILIVYRISHGNWGFLLSENVSTAPGIDASATCYGTSKYVRVLPVVVPELKLGDVERHIFGAHFVERADNTALEDRPEALNRIRVNSAIKALIIDRQWRRHFAGLGRRGRRNRRHRTRCNRIGLHVRRGSGRDCRLGIAGDRRLGISCDSRLGRVRGFARRELARPRARQRRTGRSRGGMRRRWPRRIGHRSQSVRQRRRIVKIGRLSVRRRHHSDLTIRSRTFGAVGPAVIPGARYDAVGVADGAGAGIEHDAHEDAAIVVGPRDVGRSFAQRRRQRIEARGTQRPHDFVRGHETAH